MCVSSGFVRTLEYYTNSTDYRILVKRIFFWIAEERLPGSGGESGLSFSFCRRKGVVIAIGTGKLSVVLLISGPGALVGGAGVVDGAMLV
jgi:hypothetical protein